MVHIQTNAVARPLRILYEPQVEQLGLSFDAGVPAGCGTLFSGTTEKCRGWLWVCSVDDGCLVAVHDIVPFEDLVLHEEGSDAVCMASMTAETVDTWFGGGAGGVPAVSRTENVVAFSQSERPLEGQLYAGSRYASVSITCLPAFFERRSAGQLYRTLEEGLESVSERGDLQMVFDLPVELRSSLRTIGVVPTRNGSCSERVVCDQVRQSVSALITHMDALARVKDDAAVFERARIVMRAMNCIDGNLERMVGIDELCERLNVGRTYLCHAFKAQVGAGVGAWARQRRVERAKELLVDGRMSISEVARAVGYERPGSFDDLFRRQTGTTPSAWAAAARR